MSKETFEIYFADLNEEAQQKFLAFEEMACPEEGNYDVFPIAVFEPVGGEDRYHCGSCEKTFNYFRDFKACPHCGSGNWVEGCIDE